MQGKNHLKKFCNKENYKVEFAESLQNNGYWENEMHQPQGNSGLNKNQTRFKPCRLDVFVMCLLFFQFVL
jgi:hypothetical protein